MRRLLLQQHVQMFGLFDREVPSNGSIMASNCRFCSASLRTVFVDLGMSPLANSYLRSDQLNSSEKFYPLKAFVCDFCLLVQLDEFESPDHIFSDYLYFSSVSKSWLEHSERYVEMATKRFGFNERSLVVELASNDGYLLQYFVKKGIPVLGIEPAANVAEVARQRGVPTENLFFSVQSAQRIKTNVGMASLIVANNVLAHVPKLNDFVQGIKILLAEDGVLTIEFPHLLNLVEKNQFDTIYHEHFSYFSFTVAQKVLNKHGLHIFDVEELPTHGGSLRIFACHEGNGKIITENRVSDLLKREKAAGLLSMDYYKAYRLRVEKTKRSLLAFLIEAKSQGKKVAGYGAPAKGNTLLNYCGVRTDFVDYTVDMNTFKQGLFLPGTHIPIQSPRAIFESKPDYVLILPWNLKSEIKESMKEISSWGGRFVVPIPEVEVL